MLFMMGWRACVVLLCVTLAGVGARMSAHKCPDHIDCARMGRHFCRPGSSHCGPCLSPLEEDEIGHCVARRRHNPQHHPHESSPPDVEEEIDYLSSVIAKQQITEVKQSGSNSLSSSQPRSQSRQNGLSYTITVEPSTSNLSTPTQKTPNPPQPRTDSSNRHGPIVSPHSSRDSLLVLMISLCIIVGTMALILAVVCWVQSQRETYLAQKVDYPAFNTPATGSNNNHTSSGDNSLAHSAQMYHYQHQKQQMMSMEKKKTEPKVSGETSDEENEEGDFTVYECPGLAPTGEMEVKNPLFDDSTLNSQRNHK